jgi:ribosomal protein S24E
MHLNDIGHQLLNQLIFRKNLDVVVYMENLVVVRQFLLKRLAKQWE